MQFNQSKQICQSHHSVRRLTEIVAVIWVERWVQSLQERHLHYILYSNFLVPNKIHSPVLTRVEVHYLNNGQLKYGQF